MNAFSDYFAPTPSAVYPASNPSQCSRLINSNAFPLRDAALASRLGHVHSEEAFFDDDVLSVTGSTP
jgi:hypothetical protein